ncbi:hypothetical protein FRUB_04924 [Fimbriiglobus ruber]|uniref:Uncharacterized protein n=1 Tax=Fimbriiglobus ruber TaxID=1908690 RepID=A0A225DHX6_9BACT|nr:hypothetical protein FRUB_04924 [Fimbriiglobus ruber]
MEVHNAEQGSLSATTLTLDLFGAYGREKMSHRRTKYYY